MLEWQQKFGQEREARFAALTQKALDLAPGFDSVRDSNTRAGTMPVDFTAATGTDCDIILCWVSGVW